MTKTVACACAVSAALFAAGFLLPQPPGPRPGATAAASPGRVAPALADLFDPQKELAPPGQHPSPF